MTLVILQPEEQPAQVVVQTPPDTQATVILGGPGSAPPEQDLIALAALAAHVAAENPHPAYDTIPSLSLIYTNARI